MLFIVVAHVLLLLWQLKVSIDLLYIMGKVEIGIYFCVTADILTKVLQKCSWSSLLQTIWILSKSLILTGCHGNRNVKFSRKKNSKIFFSEVIKGMKLKHCMNICVIILHINYVFYCCCTCDFIAVATLSFHRFYNNGKSESRPLFLSDFRYFDKSFTVMFLE